MKHVTIRVSELQKHELEKLLLRITAKLERKVSLREVIDTVIKAGLEAINADDVS